MKRKSTPLAGRMAYTINQFCAAHSLSRTSFYRMRQRGLAPRMMQLGRRWLISQEAAADWRRAREAA
jgi:predicted DNA-binding transcriptional regulator AlpA